MAKRIFYADLREDQVDELLTCLPPLTPARMEGIRARFEAATARDGQNPRKAGKHVLRWVAACAALLLLCTSIGLAATNRIDFQEIFNSFFTGKAKVKAILSDPVVQNGVELKLQGVYTDGFETYARVRVRDLVGARLTEWVDAEIAETMGFAASLMTRKCNPLQTTSQTQMDVILRFGDSRDGTQPVTFTIQNLGIGVEWLYDLPLDFALEPYVSERESISHAEFMRRAGVSEGGPRGYMIADDRYEPEEQSYLTQDAFSLAVPGINWARISNIGLIDGKLHVQSRKTDAYNKEYNTGYWGLQGANGENIPSLFAADIGPYNESVFDIGDRDPKDLRLSLAQGKMARSIIQGPWTLTYTPTEVAAAKEVQIVPENQPLFNRMEVRTTAMSTTIRVLFSGADADSHSMPEGPAPETEFFTQNANPMLILKNGERIVLQLGPKFPTSPAGECSFSYSTARFDIDDLQSIRLFGVDYPFE